MAHSRIKDDGIRFQIVPSTRKVTVPPAYKVIGAVDDRNSEQLTFQCPATIDGHEVGNCAEHYISWTNAKGEDGTTELKNLYIEDGILYFTWLIEAGVTKEAGYIHFTVHFEDKDEKGNTVYKWSTTTCEECQVLKAQNHRTTHVDAPEGYILPTGAIEIRESGVYDVSLYKEAHVLLPQTPGTNIIPDGYIRPSGTLAIGRNGEYDVTGHEKVDVRVPQTILTGITITDAENGKEIKAPDGHAYNVITVQVASGTAGIEEYDGTIDIEG